MEKRPIKAEKRVLLDNSKIERFKYYLFLDNTYETGRGTPEAGRAAYCGDSDEHIKGKKAERHKPAEQAEERRLYYNKRQRKKNKALQDNPKEAKEKGYGNV